MSPPIDQPIVKALIDAAIFLEFDESIDACASVAALEQMAAELQLLKQESKDALVHQLHQLAPSYQNEKHASFVSGLGESLGLV